MSNRLNSLLSAEEKAGEAVEEAAREARRIRTGIPAEISAIREEYNSELQKYEEMGMKKVHKELEVQKEKQRIILQEKKDALDSKAGELAPKALELIRSAIEGEKG